MTNADSIVQILTLFRERDRFLITSHARPDGDAIGSALALLHLLESMGKSAVVAFADPIPAMYQCLPGVERIISTIPAEPPQVAVFLECDSVQRTGFDRIPAGLLVNIDHHQSGRAFCDVNWIDPSACAVGAMLYDLAIASGVEISAAMASCLYTAVLTDTGSFTYASTISATFGLAEHLLQRGADSNAIARAIYFSNTESKVRVLAAALSNMKIEGEIAWTSLDRDELERAGAVAEDCEGIVNHLIGIAGIRAAVFLREVPGGDRFRLNLRSKGDVDVAEVAERFSGGGHRHASGCTIEGQRAEVTARILAELRNACRSPVPVLLA
jgi:phosphoesterase RecJ-like protein